MKRLILSLAMIAGLIVAVPPMATAANLNQCLQISNIRATVQGDQISVNADVSQVCSEYTPEFGGLRSYSPFYQLKPHGITCTGPSLRQGRISIGLLGLPLGQVSCSGKSESYGVGSSSLTAEVTLQGSIITSFNHTPIAAPKKLAECIAFSNPRSVNSSSAFTLSVDAYSTCSFLTREGERPVVGMLEEDSLLTLGACSAVALNAAPTGRGYLGTISCQLRVGSASSFLASTRIGATSTTLTLFFTWDFSRVNTSISHPAIPPTADRLAADKAAADKVAADKAAEELKVKQEADARVTIDAANEVKAAEDAATSAALAAGEAADAATSIAQDASDAVAALAESVNLLITEIQAQIKSLAAIVARLAKK
jgi:hypothetical protein